MATSFQDNDVLGKFTGDPIGKLAADVKETVKETCAKVAEIHFLRGAIENEYQRGYDAAAREIAAMIRRL